MIVERAVTNWSAIVRRVVKTVLLSAAILLSAPSWAQDRPWFGTWKLRLANADEKPETLVYSDAGGGAMRMVSVEADSVIVTRFDGKPSPDLGSGAGKRHALAVKAITPRSYSWTFLVAGKPIVRGRNTLSTDGRTFTEVARTVATPGKVFTLVYDRQ